METRNLSPREALEIIKDHRDWMTNSGIYVNGHTHRLSSPEDVVSALNLVIKIFSFEKIQL